MDPAPCKLKRCTAKEHKERSCQNNLGGRSLICKMEGKHA